MAHPPAKIDIKPTQIEGTGLYKKLKGFGDQDIDIEKEALRRRFVGMKSGEHGGK